MQGYPPLLMYQSLLVNKEILDRITSVFTQSPQEEGFLLGCSSQINQITHTAFLPSSRAGRYYYIPDAMQATEIIRSWIAQGVCFCGFIHSHVTAKHNLSEADLQFAETLFRAYRIPVLWFGLAVVTGGNVAFQFYSVAKQGGSIRLSPVSFEQKTVRPKEDMHESLYR